MKKLKPRDYKKAIIGAAVAGLTALGTAIDGGVTGEEVVGIIVAVLATFGSVFAARNGARLSRAES